MEIIKNLILSICISLIAAGIIGMAVPEGGHKKLMDTIMAVFILSVIISPFLSGKIKAEDFNFKLDLEAPKVESKLADTVNSRIISLQTEELESQVRKLCTDMHVNMEKIDINMDIDVDGRILIKRAEILIGKSDVSAEKIKEAVDKELKVSCEVYTFEEDEESYGE